MNQVINLKDQTSLIYGSEFLKITLTISELAFFYHLFLNTISEFQNSKKLLAAKNICSKGY